MDCTCTAPFYSSDFSNMNNYEPNVAVLWHVTQDVSWLASFQQIQYKERSKNVSTLRGVMFGVKQNNSKIQARETGLFYGKASAAIAIVYYSRLDYGM